MYLRNHYQVRNLVLRPLASSLGLPLGLLGPPPVLLGPPLVRQGPLPSLDLGSVAPSPGRASAEHLPKHMSNYTGTAKDKWMT
jgi:hypothetical protein